MVATKNGTIIICLISLLPIFILNLLSKTYKSNKGSYQRPKPLGGLEGEDNDA